LHGFILLCDYAEEVNGKLYIQGGGISRVFKTPNPLDLSIAAKLFVPWNDANHPQSLSLTLLTEDGQVVSQGEPSTEVSMGGQIEVGRPVGIRQGSDLDVPVVFRVRDLRLEVGRYRWELIVNKELVADVTFDVVQP